MAEVRVTDWTGKSGAEETMASRAWPETGTRTSLPDLASGWPKAHTDVAVEDRDWEQLSVLELSRSYGPQDSIYGDPDALGYPTV